MKFGSVCSGIEAASVAWESIGWTASWLSEIDPFPCELLDYHYPDKNNLGDMTMIPFFLETRLIEAPDVLVGGTPCQSFSLAGLRKGLCDDRGVLTLTYVDIFNKIDEVRLQNGKRESICVWENVPGVLTSKDNAFGCFLAGLAGEDCELQPPGGRWKNAGCVFGPKRTVVWRVLDAQHFGVAQRRKRVFVVASARKDINPIEILFECEGLRRDSQPSKKTKETLTQPIAIRTAQTGANGRGFDDSGIAYIHDTSGVQAVQGFRMVAFGEYADDDTASTMKARDYKDHTDLVVHGTQDPIVSTKAHTVGRNSGQENVLLCGDMVRRLTPIECERLQGFPDNYTRIPYKGKTATECPDSLRYKALGNSMAVPVMKFIGERIQLFVDLKNAKEG